MAAPTDGTAAPTTDTVPTTVQTRLWALEESGVVDGYVAFTTTPTFGGSKPRPSSRFGTETAVRSRRS